MAEMKKYYDNHLNPTFISNFTENDRIMENLYILKRDSVYHRVQVKEIWPNNTVNFLLKN